MWQAAAGDAAAAAFTTMSAAADEAMGMARDVSKSMRDLSEQAKQAEQKKAAAEQAATEKRRQMAAKAAKVRPPHQALPTRPLPGSTARRSADLGGVSML